MVVGVGFLGAPGIPDRPTILGGDIGSSTPVRWKSEWIAGACASLLHSGASGVLPRRDRSSQLDTSQHIGPRGVIAVRSAIRGCRYAWSGGTDVLRMNPGRCVWSGGKSVSLVVVPARMVDRVVVGGASRTPSRCLWRRFPSAPRLLAQGVGRRCVVRLSLAKLRCHRLRCCC